MTLKKRHSTFLIVILFQLACGKNTSRQAADEWYEKNWYEKAAFRYEKLYNLRPSYDIAVKLANSYIRLQKFEKAENLINSAIADGVEMDEYYLEYAHLLRHNGKYKEALNYYEQAGKIDTTNVIMADAGTKLTGTLLSTGDGCYSDENRNYCVELDASESIDAQRPDLILEWEFDHGSKEKGIKVSIVSINQVSTRPLLTSMTLLPMWLTIKNLNLISNLKLPSKSFNRLPFILELTLT